jgi:hypothetical protein
MSITTEVRNPGDGVWQWPAESLWFSLGTLVFATIKTDRHDITELIVNSGGKHHTHHLQMGNKKRKLQERHFIGQKIKNMNNGQQNTTEINLQIEAREPNWNGGEFKCTDRASSACLTNKTRRCTFMWSVVVSRQTAWYYFHFIPDINVKHSYHFTICYSNQNE